ncbi:MAG: hypothetical protein ACREVW_11540 [Burkholderiales bacterium]
MRDRFDFETYHWILTRVAGTNRCVRFRDFAGGDLPEPFFILRHDVDYSPAAALRLAEEEAKRAVSATYFLLAGTRYYNLLAPEHGHLARRLAELGHEVGLHYDVNFFRSFPRREWGQLLRAQAQMLSELAGAEVVSIAMHQPALNGEDPFRGDSRFINAYDPRFVRDTVYVSDSCRAWRNGGWSMLQAGVIPRRLHLCLHPINWSDHDRDRVSIFRSVHDDLIDDTRHAGDELLGKIASHTAVLEHESRVAVMSREARQSTLA